MSTLSLDLLPGLSRTARESLRMHGFETVDDVAAATPDDLRRVKGIKSSAEAIHAHALAYVSGSPRWLAPMPPQVIDTPCAYLDIETNPATGHVWSITLRAEDTLPLSILICNDMNPLVPPDHPRVFLTTSAAEGWSAAYDLLPSGAPVLHWTGFDAGVMRHTAAEPTRSLLDSVMRDLHALVKTSIAFPLKSRSLKVVAPYVGFNWKAYDRWDWALSDFQRWVYSGEEQCFTRMLAYIQDDVDAMAVVMAWLRANRA